MDVTGTSLSSVSVKDGEESAFADDAMQVLAEHVAVRGRHHQMLGPGGGKGAPSQILGRKRHHTGTRGGGLRLLDGSLHVSKTSLDL